LKRVVGQKDRVKLSVHQGSRRCQPYSATEDGFEIRRLGLTDWKATMGTRRGFARDLLLTLRTCDKGHVHFSWSVGAASDE
jgi:hypothetical protein